MTVALMVTAVFYGNRASNQTRAKFENTKQRFLQGHDPEKMVQAIFTSQY